MNKPSLDKLSLDKLLLDKLSMDKLSNGQAFNGSGFIEKATRRGDIMSIIRIDRISEEVRREIDKIIREDVNDPRIGGTYSITHADVTRDLRFAKVYVSILEAEKRDPMISALKNAAGYIRRELGQRIQLRYVPQLLFELDTNIEYSSRIGKLIDEAVRHNEPKESE